MSTASVALIIAALVCAGVFLNPRTLRSPLWKATVTPLASIIGSGFLVAGPILSLTAGTAAWLAMLGLCTLGYLFGSAIRYNIRHVEPLLANDPPKGVAWLDDVSDLVLSFCYFISVAYYLNLFAAFMLRIGGIVDPFWARVLATTVIGGVGLVGLFGGLKGLERIATGAVGLKLSLIGGVITALIVSSAMELSAGTFAWPDLSHPHGFNELRILLGLVILVQGFETSRYLGEAYDAETRIRTMRWAQWISTAIYIVFILTVTRYFEKEFPAEGGDTAIIDMLRPLGIALAPAIILTALASQLSAAVADTNGAGGLLSESSHNRLKVNFANLLTAIAAIAITWIADIFQIITYASQAFVSYYALQSLQAARMAYLRRHILRAVLYLLLAMTAVAVAVLAIPAHA